MDPLMKSLRPVERKPDGELYRMTPAQCRRAGKMIRGCCNYDRETGFCLPLDDICPQLLTSGVACRQFRWCLMEDDPVFKAQVLRDSSLWECSVCGKLFRPRSNNAKYCPDCAAGIRRRKKSEYERKRRARMGVQVSGKPDG